MKQILITSILVILGLIFCNAQELSLMTYNIKNDYQKTGPNNWEGRKSGLLELIGYYQPAIFGIQEALFNQINDIDAFLPNYKYIGVGREDGISKGEYSAIYFDTTLIELVKSNTFWLSETPNQISKGWDAAYERICTYGLFKSIDSGISFWVFNTHFDHIGNNARENSMILIQNKIEDLNLQDLPVIVMGDFNLEPSTVPILKMKKVYKDAFDVSEKKAYGPEGTFNGFNKTISKERIDYFFIQKVTVHSYSHIDDRLKNQDWPSDHLPILIQASFITN